MKEEFLHYIWKYKLFNDKDLLTENKEIIQIIHQGTHNYDSGPDFFNAKIKIDDTVWVGNVEIHVKSSDWFLHKHDKDKAYDNVILQVVYQHDQEVYRTNGQLIPTLQLKFDASLLGNYDSLISKETWVPCQDKVQKVDSFVVQNWLEKIAIERLEEKSVRIKQTLDQNNSNWEEAFYIHIARNFGFNLNSDPFEQLAKSLPLNYLAKHKDNLFQIEALLFGQAGFLYDDGGDEYFLKLKNEYQYLKKKFKLKSIPKYQWKFLRSRPSNFPTIRIAQFAKLIHNSSALFSKIIETEKISDFYQLFQFKTSEYWDNHYVFNKESIKKNKVLGKSAVDIIMINTIIPFLFIYGKTKGLSELQERSIHFLEEIKPEKNSIITKWYQLGVESANAFNTQALIQLKNKYCNHKKCLNCQIGNFIIQYVNEPKTF